MINSVGLMLAVLSLSIPLSHADYSGQEQKVKAAFSKLNQEIQKISELRRSFGEEDYSILQPVMVQTPKGKVPFRFEDTVEMANRLEGQINAMLVRSRASKDLIDQQKNEIRAKRREEAIGTLSFFKKRSPKLIELEERLKVSIEADLKLNKAIQAELKKVSEIKKLLQFFEKQAKNPRIVQNYQLFKMIDNSPEGIQQFVEKCRPKGVISRLASWWNRFWHGPDAINRARPDGTTPLMAAAEKGLDQTSLLAEMSFVGARDKRGNTAMMRAAKAGYGYKDKTLNYYGLRYARYKNNEDKTEWDLFTERSKLMEEKNAARKRRQEEEAKRLAEEWRLEQAKFNERQEKFKPLLDPERPHDLTPAALEAMLKSEGLVASDAKLEVREIKERLGSSNSQLMQVFLVSPDGKKEMIYFVKRSTSHDGEAKALSRLPEGGGEQKISRFSVKRDEGEKPRFQLKTDMVLLPEITQLKRAIDYLDLKGKRQGFLVLHAAKGKNFNQLVEESNPQELYGYLKEVGKSIAYSPYSHGDFHQGNFLYDPKTKRTHLIDNAAMTERNQDHPNSVDYEELQRRIVEKTNDLIASIRSYAEHQPDSNDEKFKKAITHLQKQQCAQLGFNEGFFTAAQAKPGLNFVGKGTGDPQDQFRRDLKDRGVNLLLSSAEELVAFKADFRKKMEENCRINTGNAISWFGEDFCELKCGN